MQIKNIVDGLDHVSAIETLGYEYHKLFIPGILEDPDEAL
jgi:hypothetical protein